MPTTLPTPLFADSAAVLGIGTVIAVKVGLLTPPFRHFFYVIRSVIDDPAVTLWDIFARAGPVALIMIVVLGFAFPALATAPL